MQLIEVAVRGFRRFEELTTMDVVGSPIAIVGPNEAGKTSFLRALIHLNSNEGFDPLDLTRDGNNDALVRARFALDQKDWVAIRPVGGVGRPRFYISRNERDGRIRSALEPPLQRNLEPRRKALAAVERVRRSRWNRSRGDSPPAETLVELSELLASTDAFDSASTDWILAAVEQMKMEVNDPSRSLLSLFGRLESLAEIEARPEPNVEALNILQQRAHHLVDEPGQTLARLDRRHLQNRCSLHLFLLER